MNKYFSYFAVFFATAFFTFAGADHKIAVVDLNEVFQKSSAGKNFTAEVKNQQESLEKSFSNKEKDLYERVKQLGNQKEILSEKAFKEKEDALNQDMINIQQEFKNNKFKLDNSFKLAIDGILNEVNSIISDVAKNKKLDLVLQKTQVSYMSDDIKDITDTILENLNKKLPQINFNELEKVNDKKS